MKKQILSILSASILTCLGTLQAERDSNTIILNANAVKNLRIKTIGVEESTFEKTVFAIGRIDDIPSNRSVLSSRIAGRVVTLHVFEGDKVKNGQVLASVETRQIGDPPPVIDLLSSQSGVIIASHARLGQPVEPNLELMDIADRSKMWAIAKIPEEEAALVDIGSIAHIRIPATGKTFDAKLKRFGVSADKEAGTVDGIFEIDNVRDRLRPGMRVEFSIVLSRRDDVLAIPRESLQGDPANRVVYVKDFELPNAFLRSSVVLGDENDTMVEIVSGLFPGDEIVTKGSYMLGFVGNGNQMSLKEALDAAHGHEHNEDGSEISEDQKKSGSKDEHSHEGEDGDSSKGLIVYATLMTLLALILLSKRSKK